MDRQEGAGQDYGKGTQGCVMIMIKIFVFILGALIGSFLNVCIYRLPRGESLVFPGSHCVHCNNKIPWFDNIPLVSYLLLRGRCRFCARVISFRYFVVEFITGALLLTLFVSYGVSIKFFSMFVLAGALIVSSFIDLEHQIIPDVITVPGVFIGLSVSLLYPSLLSQTHHLGGLLRSLAGVLVGGGSIYVMGVLGRIAFRKEAMGGGDVKLMAMIGAFIGWKMVLLTFFLAPFFGAVAGIIVRIKEKKELIPYGPYLSIATFISVLFGEKIINWLYL